MITNEACGLGPVLAWDLLETLTDFPAGLAVPVSGLAGPVRRRLAGARPAWWSSARAR